MTDAFTREQLLEAMTISPCHITGTHDPTHTPKFICTYQLKEAIEGIFALLEIGAEDLPRQPHAWPNTGDSGKLEDAWVNKRPITFTSSNLPDSWSSFHEAWKAACDARKANGGDKFSLSAITKGMKEPETVAHW